jgi:hypothetical protein
MGLLDETRYPERLQFFNGQRLFADDLQGVEAFNREMRWLHNRSLHQVGIGNGYKVTGNKGDRQVTIGPGYAIDLHGREIVLTQEEVQPIPPVAADTDGGSVFFDLTVSYLEDGDMEVVETREGICLPRGTVRLREQPIFCWVRLQKDPFGNLQPKDAKLAADIKDGRKIILARVEIFNCQLNGMISIVQRRSARPPEQPRIVCGEVKPTNWRVESLVEIKPSPSPTPSPGTTISSGDASPAPNVLTGFGFDTIRADSISSDGSAQLLPPVLSPFKLVADVDTRSAGFLTLPSYTARIVGSRLITLTEPSPSEGGEGGEGSQPISVSFVVDGLLNVLGDRTSPKGFSVEVLLLVQFFPDLETDESSGSRSGPRSPVTDLERRAIQIAQRFQRDNSIDTAKQQIADALKDWYLVWMGVEE